MFSVERICLVVGFIIAEKSFSYFFTLTISILGFISYKMSEVLLLGMVFSDETEPKRGQEYRDRVRCEALETLGYSVKTLDNKHKDDVLTNGKHCTANFADSRRMLKSMNTRWEKSIFDHIILDCFFSPVINSK